ncbi:reverse transcriptase domain-containing protein [Tanacetum coccineum]
MVTTLFDDRIRLANLLPIHMFDFDVILGMDWLASHRATIDCYARTVIFARLPPLERLNLHWSYSGADPISKAEYVWHLLIEGVKEQLQEMLENGFI